MTHGSGGRAMAQLIEELFGRAFDNEWLRQGNDGACFAPPPGRMVMATDTHVVSPLFFPGGDIGCLSVHGTINDVAVMGATPLHLAAGFVLEEGFPLADLLRIVQSMAAASREASVPIVTGDTKVVEKGKGTACSSRPPASVWRRKAWTCAATARAPAIAFSCPGRWVMHGVTIMSLREGLAFETSLTSDYRTHGTGRSQRCWRAGPDVQVLRDRTPGGRGDQRLNQIARQSGRRGIVIDEAAVPVQEEVGAACEILGSTRSTSPTRASWSRSAWATDADRLLSAMRAHPQGRDAAIVGEVIEDPHHFVQMDTRFGGRRVVDWLTGEQLPRIC